MNRGHDLGGSGRLAAKRGPYSMRRPRMVTMATPHIRDGRDGHPDGWSASRSLDLAELFELGVEVVELPAQTPRARRG